MLEIHDIRTEVEALGLPYRYELSARRSGAATRTTERCSSCAPPGARCWRSLPAFRRRAAVRLEERLINLAAVPEAGDEEFCDTRAGPWLIGRVPWSAAEHRIRAMAADEAVADGARHRSRRALPGGRAPHLERRPAGHPCPVYLCRPKATRWWRGSRRRRGEACQPKACGARIGFRTPNANARSHSEVGAPPWASPISPRWRCPAGQRGAVEREPRMCLPGT